MEYYAKVNGNISTQQVKLSGNITINGGGSYPHYQGEYVIIPKFIEQILPTSKKVLDSDVTVEEIPVYKTENLGGGYTVVIGGN